MGADVAEVQVGREPAGAGGVGVVALAVVVEALAEEAPQHATGGPAAALAAGARRCDRSAGVASAAGAPASSSVRRGGPASEDVLRDSHGGQGEAGERVGPRALAEVLAAALLDEAAKRVGGRERDLGGA